MQWLVYTSVLPWFVSCFQKPSVMADTQVLALPCRVHHTLFRDTPTAVTTTLTPHRTVPRREQRTLTYRHSPSTPRHILGSPPSAGSLWVGSPSGLRPCCLLQSPRGPRHFPTLVLSPPGPSLRPTIASFPSQLPIFRLLQTKFGQQTLCHTKPRYSKNVLFSSSSGGWVSEALWASSETGGKIPVSFPANTLTPPKCWVAAFNDIRT